MIKFIHEDTVFPQFLLHFCLVKNFTQENQQHSETG